MDWLGRLNLALDYIEQNLDNEIDFSKAAMLACCSSYQFQRIFSLISDITLGEYIRRRRLTCAAFDLANTEEKIIDIALKYGYDSPSSFTRAFQNMHGVTPSAAREKSIYLKSYPRIFFSITIKGDTSMNYKIEEKGAIRLVGVKRHYRTDNGENFEKIPLFWKEVCENGTSDKMCKLSSSKSSCLYGACADFNDNCVDYYIAVESTADVPANMSELKIEPATWAVFECVGPNPEAMQSVWKRIFTEWFPMSGYEHADAPEIEWYSDGDMMSQTYKSEIWIPVIKK